MTTPATPATATATPPAAAAPQGTGWREWADKVNARHDALSAAVTAIARHITGAVPGSEHDALVRLGLSHEHADVIAPR
jgi:hypothetical protein